MLFSENENLLYEFYESLTEEQRDRIDLKMRVMIPELRKNGVDEGDIYTLKCIIAKDLYRSLNHS
jgi:hypothetical protein